MIPEFLQAAQLYQAPNSGVLKGIGQGVDISSGVLNTIQQKQNAAQESAFNAQKLKIAADEAASRKIEDERNWEISKTQLGIKEQAAPLQNQLTISEINKNIADALALKKKKDVTPGDDALAKANANQFVKDFTQVNGDANEALTKNIPLLNELKGSLAATPTGTGPMAGKFVWTTPEGQYFLNRLKEWQKIGFKGVKNIRNQREFELMISASGDPNITQDKLQKIFSEELAGENLKVDKAKHYSDYAKTGKSDPEEVASGWLDNIQKKQQKGNADNVTKWNSIQAAAKKNPQAFAVEAKQHGMTPQQFETYIKSNLGVQ